MPPKNRNKKSATPVESTRHKDKLKNIPTAELQDFVREDEIKPKKVLYPRDSSLDPQIVWKGKDEHTSFEVLHRICVNPKTCLT